MLCLSTLLTHDGSFFFSGGYSGSERLSDMFSYDFETNHWSQVDCTSGDAPSGRSSLVAQVYENCLYVFGESIVGCYNDIDARKFLVPHFLFCCRWLQWTKRPQ